MGSIRIGRGIVDILTAAELDFVLAHEVVHIVLNHYVETFTFGGLRAFFDSLAANDQKVKLVLGLWELTKVFLAAKGRLPPHAEATKAHEIEADMLAVRLTCNKAAAKSGLTRLVGGDLDAPSHKYACQMRKWRCLVVLAFALSRLHLWCKTSAVVDARAPNFTVIISA